jgi:hypothetical protein
VREACGFAKEEPYLHVAGVPTTPFSAAFTPASTAL